MASRTPVPPSSHLALPTERAAAPARAPLVNVAAHRDFVPTDHSLRQTSHDPVLEHHTNPTDHHVVPLSAPVLGRRQPAGRPGGHERSFFSSDDSVLTKQIEATHAPDVAELDVRPVLSIVEDIMRLAKPLSSETTLV